MSKRSSNGFTLVEILIVVVILGILAAIVIPQFTNASESAKASSVVTQLQNIRSQLELYQVQHNGTYPDLVTNWNQVTQTTDAAGATTGTDYGPYLQQAPKNGFTNSNNVVASPGPGTTSDGWVYNQATGAITAVGFDEDTFAYTPPAAP